MGDDKSSGQGAGDQTQGRKGGLDINTPVLHEEPDKTTNASSVNNTKQRATEKPVTLNVNNTKNRRKFELLP